MNIGLRIFALSLLPLITQLTASDKAAEDWDLVRAFNASNYVFYGSIAKTVPEPNFRTEVLGLTTTDLFAQELKAQPIVWPKSREFTFAVSESFKEPTPQTFSAYLPDTPEDVWIFIKNDLGDTFLSKPAPFDPVYKDLYQNQEGLFFIRYFIGSTIPTVYKFRLGQNAEEDLKLLRLFQQQPHLSIETIYAQELERRKQVVAQEAIEYRKFEDEYYKILRIQDLDIRKSMLDDLITRMGFEDRWDFYEHKKQYLETHGAHIPDNEVPSGPTEGREKIWHDASGELKKIDVIQSARRKKPDGSS